MKIDLFKLNNYNYLEIDEDLEIDPSIYEKTEIRNILDLHVNGYFKIEYDEVIACITISGKFILPCAITLEDVIYPFETEVDENIGNFEDFYNKNKNTLDILPFLWENIISEVPIRVVKDGITVTEQHGDGWQLVSGE